LITLPSFPTRIETISRRLILAGSLAFLALIGCSKSIQHQPTQLFRAIGLDSLFVLDSPNYHQLVISAYPADWAAGRTMVCVISGAGVTTQFLLYDDGGLGRWHDTTGFTDAVSGDQIAGDGYFSRRITSAFASAIGTYRFTFSFVGGAGSVDSLRQSVQVVHNSPPTVVQFSAPDSLHSGQIGSPFTTTVLDPDGQIDITSVELSFMHPRRDSVYYAMDRQSDTTWSLVPSPAIAAGIPTGNYRFFVRATDWSGEGRAYSDTQAVAIENLPPRIMLTVGPDTVWVSPGDTARFHYDVIVADDQTPLDLDTLLLTLTRRDTTSGEEVFVAKFSYFDDGTGLDSLTGDGGYRAGFSADINSHQQTPFTFTWTPTDHSPQHGTSAQNVMVIMPVPGNGSPPKRALPDLPAHKAGEKSGNLYLQAFR
jgi:hypothetical protein